MFLQHVLGAGAVLALPALEGTRVAVHEGHVLPKHVRTHEAFRALATRERFGLVMHCLHMVAQGLRVARSVVTMGALLALSVLPRYVVEKVVLGVRGIAAAGTLVGTLVHFL